MILFKVELKQLKLLFIYFELLICSKVVNEVMINLEWSFLVIENKKILQKHLY